MDWFERLAGFRETGYDDTRNRLKVEGEKLRSRVNGRNYGIGNLELISLGNLRKRAASVNDLSGHLTLRNVTGDIRRLHQRSEYAGALFQVASQFNLLEMVRPDVIPEQGVTRYEDDPTQGPACAIAAGAATIYRNYFVPVADGYGQTSDRQINCLAEIGDALGRALSVSVDDLWKMRNGYALCTRHGLIAIGDYLRSLNDDERDALRAQLRVGLHADVEVTDGENSKRQSVSQVFCSALPVAYSRLPVAYWEPFAQLVLEAAYEATLWAAVLNAQRSSSNVVLLTRLGAGAFGNDETWIDMALRRALANVKDFGLDALLVSFGAPPASMLALESDFRKT
jgi:hypothetical protein